MAVVEKLPLAEVSVFTSKTNSVLLRSSYETGNVFFKTQ